MVFLTAYSQSDLLARIEQVGGASAYLVKPWELGELASPLRLVVQRHRVAQAREDGLRESAEALLALRQAVVTVDCSGAVTFANPAACRLIRTELAEQRGRLAVALYAIADSAPHPISEALGGVRDVGRGPVRRLVARPDRVLEVGVSHFRRQDADVDELLVVLTDVTERERIRRALEHERRRSDLAQQAAELAHGINNPLAAALAQAQAHQGELPWIGDLLASLEEIGRHSAVMMRIAHQLETSSSPSEGDPDALAEQQLRLMLVDDDVRLLKALSRLLRRTFEVSVATGAAQARDLLEEEAWDVLLFDVNMPGEDGFQLYATLPESLRERVVFMSGGLTGDAGRRVIASGRPVLTKPFTLEQLAAVLGHR